MKVKCHFLKLALYKKLMVLALIIATSLVFSGCSDSAEVKKQEEKKKATEDFFKVPEEMKNKKPEKEVSLPGLQK